MGQYAKYTTGNCIDFQKQVDARSGGIPLGEHEAYTLSEGLYILGYIKLSNSAHSQN